MFHEMYGLLVEELENEKARHAGTVALLRRIAAGEVDPSWLVINGDTWLVEIPAPEGVELLMEATSEDSDSTS